MNRVPVDRELPVLAKKLFLGRDRVIGQRDRAEDSLHRRARLERVLDRRVVQTVVKVGAVGVHVRHRHHFAGKRIEHDHAAALRAAGLHFRRQFGFGERLDRRVDRQLELRARLRRLERERAVENRMPLRVVIEAQLDRFAAHNPVVLQFQSGEPLAVHPSQPHHRRGQVALRVKPLVFANRADAVDSERFRRLPLVRRDPALEPHERRRLVQFRFKRNRQHHQNCGELVALGRRARLGNPLGPRVNRAGLGRQRQRLAVAIDDRTAHRGELGFSGMLVVRERVQLRPVKRHQHHQPNHRQAEQGRQRERECSDSSAPLLERCIHGSITTCPRPGGAR